jgi:hypothetical protein
MAWKTEYLADLNIIETTMEGIFSAIELQTIIKSVLDLLALHGLKHVLVDCTKVAHNNSVFNIYELPVFYESLKVDHNIKQAVILPKDKEARKNIKFYETVTRNRGFNVLVFDDQQSSIQWLLE